MPILDQNGSPGDTAEAMHISIDNQKNALEELRIELYGASKDVAGAYKRYASAKNKVNIKRSSRNLARLAKTKNELGMLIDGYSATHKRVEEALDAVIRAHDKYVEALYVGGEASMAKRSSRSMDSYVRKIERFINKTDDSIACISSHYNVCIRDEQGDESELQGLKTSSNSEYGAQNSVPSAAYVHTNEVEISPVSIDIGPAVERAVDNAMAELSDTLNKRLAEYFEALELPTSPVHTERTDTVALEAAVSELGEVGKKLNDVLSRLDSIMTETEQMAERCKAIVEMQRCTVRDMQGTQVKQKLVNQEQAELVEAQEVVLQHQKIISEKHAQIREAQTVSSDAINAIIDAQQAIDASLKNAIQSQKALLQSNSKNAEQLNKQIEKSAATRDAMQAMRIARKRNAEQGVASEAQQTQNMVEVNTDNG